jgi:alkylation response protein AidB-like acyl-CoA dehydrogenase
MTESTSMNFEPDPQEDAFRDEVRDFVAANLPAYIAERTRRFAHPRREDLGTWMRILYDKGWAAVGWPVDYGGTEWSGMRRIIFEEECLNGDAPPQHFANIHSVGPVIFTFGTAAQKERFLQPMLRGDELWCQGFSEPGAGSDLASLTTRAERDGDQYVVNGQKLWTSDADISDYMFALVRTDSTVAKQKGISFLLIDMKSPGITVRPIDLIDGSHAVCEVVLDNVRVPAANLVGNEGQGWTIAKFLLANERAFSAEVPATKRDMKRILQIARETPYQGKVLWDYAIFRARFAELQSELDALEYSVMRAVIAGDHDASGLASLVKIPGSELRQKASALLVEALGPYGMARYPVSADDGVADDLPGPAEARNAAATFAFRRATTIYGGANEVQREIIAKANLQL